MKIPQLKGYQEGKSIKFNFIVLTIVSLFMGLAALILFNILRFWIENGSFSGESSGSLNPMQLLGAMLVVLITIIVHELIHGMTFKLFDYKVKYGVIMPFAAYAMADKQFMRRRDYFIVGLAPLFVINTVSLLIFFLRIPLLSDIAYVAIVFNTAGAVGDIWLASKIFSSPKGTLYYDYSPSENYVYLPK